MGCTRGRCPQLGASLPPRFWLDQLRPNTRLLCYVASWVGFSPHRWQTPYEYSRMLSRHFPEQAYPLWHLTELFVRDRWGAPQQVPQAHEEAYAEHLWSSLRGMVMKLALKKVEK